MGLLSAASDYFPFLLPRQAPKYVTEDGKRVYGMVAEFGAVPAVYHAAKKVRDAGYTRWDVHSPFPIHGIDDAMGMKRSKLPFIAGGAALMGVVCAVLLQYYTNAWDYQFVVQGKPYGAWEPFVPVTFELGVLFTAFACLLGMMALNGLPRFHHPLLAYERFAKTSDDRFMIAIEADDPIFDAERTRALLESIGGTDIALVEDD